MTDETKWPDGLGLFINGGPDDHCELWDIWHDGGPGGPFCDARTQAFAEMLCAAIAELNRLRRLVAVERGDETQALPGWSWDDDAGGWIHAPSGAILDSAIDGRAVVWRPGWGTMMPNGDIVYTYGPWCSSALAAMEAHDADELARGGW